MNLKILRNLGEIAVKHMAGKAFFRSVGSMRTIFSYLFCLKSLRTIVFSILMAVKIDGNQRHDNVHRQKQC